MIYKNPIKLTRLSAITVSLIASLVNITVNAQQTNFDIPGVTCDSLPSFSGETARTKDFTIESRDVQPFIGYAKGYNVQDSSSFDDRRGSLSAKLEFRVFYSDGNWAKKIKKPIVVIDGWDPKDARKIEKRDYAPGTFIEGKTKTIAEFMTYQKDGSGDGERVSIIAELQKDGFDVVVVNHPVHCPRPGLVVDGGTDYIERNALAHVELINFLNQRVALNGSTEELIIVGPSMGGQISRYALAYMEKHGMDHRTKLWVSIDSPHHGANIPIGLQSVVHKLWTHPDEKDPKVAEFYFNEIQSVAAQQQLIEQHNPDSRVGSEDKYLNNKSPVRQQYIENLTTNGLPGSGGWPVKPRKVAMVNGSLVGLKVGIAGEEDLRAHGFLQRQVLGWEVPGVYQVLDLSTRYMPEFNEHGSVSSLWIEEQGRVGLNVTNRNSNGSMDIVPGGLFNAEQELMDALVGSDPTVPETLGSDPNLPDSYYEPIFGGFNLKSIREGIAFFGKLRILYGSLDIDIEPRTNKVVHSFIPTYSSLAIKDASGDWGRSLNRNLVCTGETPFDSYYAPRENQEHTSFNAESVEWMMAELANVHQPPSAYPSEINGSISAICGNETFTFSVDRCDVPQPPVWSVNSGLSIVSRTPYSVTVKGTDNFRNYSNVQANYDYWQTDKKIYIGKPQAPSSLSGPSTVSKSSVARYQAGSAVGATSYRWAAPYPFATLPYLQYSSLNWEVQRSQGQTMNAFTGLNGNAGFVQAMGVNRCGTGGGKSIRVSQSSSGGGIECPSGPGQCIGNPGGPIP